MAKREHILNALETVRHPEIAASLPELGMILDVAVEDQTVRVAVALPNFNIPQSVRLAIEKRIRAAIQKHHMEPEFHYFEMTEEARSVFFAQAKAKWKGAV